MPPITSGRHTCPTNLRSPAGASWWTEQWRRPRTRHAAGQRRKQQRLEAILPFQTVSGLRLRPPDQEDETEHSIILIRSSSANRELMYTPQCGCDDVKTSRGTWKRCVRHGTAFIRMIRRRLCSFTDSSFGRPRYGSLCFTRARSCPRTASCRTIMHLPARSGCVKHLNE